MLQHIQINIKIIDNKYELPGGDEHKRSKTQDIHTCIGLYMSKSNK